MLNKLIKSGILVLAVVLILEKVYFQWRYLPSDPNAVTQVQLGDDVSELLTPEGKLTQEGWAINHPWLVNNQDKYGSTFVRERNLNILLL